MRYKFRSEKRCGVYWSMFISPRKHKEAMQRARQRQAAHKARKAKGRRLHAAHSGRVRDMTRFLRSGLDPRTLPGWLSNRILPDFSDVSQSPLPRVSVDDLLPSHWTGARAMIEAVLLPARRP